MFSVFSSTTEAGAGVGTQSTKGVHPLAFVPPDSFTAVNVGVGGGVEVAVGRGVDVAVGRRVAVAVGCGVAVGRGVAVGATVGDGTSVTFSSTTVSVAGVSSSVVAVAFGGTGCNVVQAVSTSVRRTRTNRIDVRMNKASMLRVFGNSTVLVILSPPCTSAAWGAQNHSSGNVRLLAQGGVGVATLQLAGLLGDSSTLGWSKRLLMPTPILS